jgi:hypothetical protein
LTATATIPTTSTTLGLLSSPSSLVTWAPPLFGPRSLPYPSARSLFEALGGDRLEAEYYARLFSARIGAGIFRISY